MMNAIKRLFTICIGLGALLAFISTVVLLGYAFKIILFIGAVVLVFVFVLFLVYAAIKEFVIDAIKKPTK